MIWHTAEALKSGQFPQEPTLVRRRTRSLLLPSQNPFYVCAGSTTILEREIGFWCRVTKFYRDGSEDSEPVRVECLLRLGYCKGTWLEDPGGKKDLSMRCEFRGP